MASARLRARTTLMVKMAVTAATITKAAAMAVETARLRRMRSWNCFHAPAFSALVAKPLW
jgi:hypothetical protein